MNSKHAFLALSVFTLVSIAHGEREVFAPTKLAPVAEAGTIKFNDGTAAAPSMTFKNDDNTGFFRWATDQIGIALNSTTRAVFSGGSLVIGGGFGATPTDGQIKGVNAAGTNIVGGNLLIDGGNSTGNANGGSIRFGTSSPGAAGTSSNGTTERMRIASTGRVGIGTTNPAATLHVVNSNLVNQFRVQDVETDTTTKVGVFGVGHYTNSQVPLSVIFGRSQSGLSDVTIGGGSSSFNAATEIRFNTAATTTTTTGTERMRIDSAGNVGIGSSSNLSTLTVNGAFASKSPSLVNAATYVVASTDASLRFTTTNCTVTLPTASSFPGRILYLNTVTANSVTSNASNVKPLGSDTAGTTILGATAGKFAMIQSDGTNWITMMAN